MTVLTVILAAGSLVVWLVSLFWAFEKDPNVYNKVPGVGKLLLRMDETKGMALAGVAVVAISLVFGVVASKIPFLGFVASIVFAFFVVSSAVRIQKSAGTT